MGFRFSLQAILDLRQSLEHQEELRLRSANHHVHKVQHQIEQIDIRMHELNVLLSRDILAGLSGAELLFCMELNVTLRFQRQALERELSRLEQIREKQQRAFQEVHRQRETLGILRDSQLREYTRESAREQQRLLDDLFLCRKTNAPSTQE